MTMSNIFRRMAGRLSVGALAAGLLAGQALATTTPQTLPFSQNWSNTGLITANDDWSGVPGIVGYLGATLVGGTGSDPQTILTTEATIDVIAQSLPTSTSGGVHELDGLADPVVGFQGSGSSKAPNIVLYLNTTGFQSVLLTANLRDVDPNADNSIQPVAVQYRVGGTGNFINLPSAFTADASTGPSIATLVTPISVTLPGAANNKALVEIRFITSDAAGSDEMIGVDDISVTGTPFVPAVTDYTVSPTSLFGGTLVDKDVDTLPILVSTVISATTGTVTIDSVNLTGSGDWTEAPGNPTSVTVGTTASLTFRYTPTANDGIADTASVSVVTSGNTPTSFTLALSGNTVVDSSIAAFKAALEAGTAGTSTYKMTGVVNSTNLVTGGDGFAFQDLITGSASTRGMSAFDSPNAFITPGTMPAVGDTVLFYGTAASFRGLAEIVPTRAFSVTASGATIVPVAIDGTAMSDATESVLVTVNDAIVPVGTFGPGGTNVVVTDDSTSTFTMRLQSEAAITYTGVNVPLAMTGVVGQFDVTNPLSGGTGFQLQPRFSSEVPVEVSAFEID